MENAEERKGIRRTTARRLLNVATVAAKVAAWSDLEDSSDDKNTSESKDS